MCGVTPRLGRYCEIAFELWKLEWQQYLLKIKKQVKDAKKILEAFDKVWCPHHAICVRDGRKMRWYYQPSHVGYIMW
jgi:hypothetical protein